MNKDIKEKEEKGTLHNKKDKARALQGPLRVTNGKKTADRMPTETTARIEQ